MGYTIDANGIVTSPGKFEGEPEFVVHYWELGLEGSADSDDEGKFTFKLGIDDAVGYHNKLQAGDTLVLWEDDNGFVHHELVKRLSDTEIVKAIHQYLCEHEAGADAYNYIAELLSNNGYPVTEVERLGDSLGPDDFDRYVTGDR
jgi:hypothetical protein